MGATTQIQDNSRFQPVLTFLPPASDIHEQGLTTHYKEGGS